MSRHRRSTPEDTSLVISWLKELCVRSVRLGQPFGVEVRVLWSYVIIAPLLALYWYSDFASSLVILTAVLVWPVLLALIICSHEMGHIMAAWRYGISAPLITLSPLGGLAHMESAAPTRRSEIIIALAGPAVHLAWLVFCWPVFHYFGAPQVADGEWAVFGRTLLLTLTNINIALMIFNLLPTYPLDGGRVLRAMLSTRMPAGKAAVLAAEIGIFGAVVGAIWAIMQGGLSALIMVLIAAYCFFECLNVILIDRMLAQPRQRRRSRGQHDDADWWKEGQRSQELEGEDLSAKVDEVLDRINAVGIGGLTTQERKILKRASKERQGD